MPSGVSSASRAASQISTPAGHSAAARRAPASAPRTPMTRMRWAPHSRRVWMAAALVPPVAMTGSRMMAREDVEAAVAACSGRLL